MQGLGQYAMPHGQHHLDDTAHDCRGLAVADIRLQRPQPQRPVLSPVLPIRGNQCLASIGSPSAVPVPWASTASTSSGDSPAFANACRITRCWEIPFGAVRPLLAPS